MAPAAMKITIENDNKTPNKIQWNGGGEGETLAKKMHKIKTPIVE